MFSEKNKTMEKIGKKIGYILGYFIFTTVLFYVLTYFNKLPSNWTYFNIMSITLITALIGIFLRRILK